MRSPARYRKSCSVPADYRLADGVLRAELENQEVLLNPATGQYHLLNKTGRRVLALWEQGSSTEEIEELLVAEGGPGGTVGSDVASFVRALEERGLIVAGQ
jgi:hypothetical protein